MLKRLFSLRLNVPVCVIATALVFVCDSPALAADGSEQLAQANEFFKEGQWSQAEKAFLGHAKETKDKAGELQSKYKAGICRLRMNKEGDALSLFREITENASSVRIAPTVTGDAFDHLHLLYIKQKKTTDRVKLVNDCCQAIPGSLVTGRICEREADAYLCDKAVVKAVEFYTKAGAGLSPYGTNILMLLSLPNAGAMNAAPLSERDAERLSAVLAEREKCGLILCDILSKAKDGWRAQDALARRHVAKERYAEAVAIWDALVKARQGPVEELAFVSADAFAKTGNSAAAATRYAAWLSSYPKDMAAVVFLFTRLTGGETVQVQRVDGSFNTKKILPIEHITWKSELWTHHQFAWFNGKVYDACVQLNESAAYIPVGDDLNTNYKENLLDKTKKPDDWNPRSTPFDIVDFY